MKNEAVSITKVVHVNDADHMDNVVHGSDVAHVIDPKWGLLTKKSKDIINAAKQMGFQPTNKNLVGAYKDGEWRRYLDLDFSYKDYSRTLHIDINNDEGEVSGVDVSVHYPERKIFYSGKSPLACLEASLEEARLYIIRKEESILKKS